MRNPDAIVVGSGPNGLAAAIVLAQAGRSVTVFEAEPAVGGGVRSAELTLPGFVHDICSAIHPMAVNSPLFRTLPLAAHGLDWVEPDAMIAHPLDDGSAVIGARSVQTTAAALGRDGAAYERVIGRLAANWQRLERSLLGPFTFPRHPLLLARVGWWTPRSAEHFARHVFTEQRTRALIAGMGAHSILPLDRAPTGVFSMVMTATTHAGGWVFPRGGAQRLTDALASYLRSLGGEIVTSSPVRSIDDLPKARAILCDLSPRPLIRIAGHRLPAGFRRKLDRYRYGAAAFKVDWALDGPIPWRAADCARSATVHLGGTLEEIAQSEREVWDGGHPERPFVLLAQQSLFDSSRAPAGRHTAWGYCHVPNGSQFDMLPRIEQQIERFAPGFRDRVLARSVMTPADLERHNANLVGGDIGSGAMTLSQLFARPTWRWYSTPVRGLYLCSASTPPGVGVHGMCGYFAAKRALKEVLS